MKKNGFTLVEILAVFVLVATIAIIAVPSIIYLLNKDKDEISDATKEIILAGANIYLSQNQNEYYESIVNEYCITLEDIVNSGALEAPIIDSVSGEEIDLNKFIKVSYVFDDKLKSYKVNYEITKQCQSKQYSCISANGYNKIEIVTGNESDYVYYPGDEYKCELGDGILRTFYVSSVNEDKISLIMDQNIDEETVAWCKTGNHFSCNADGALEALSNKTSNWTKLNSSQITLPSVWPEDNYSWLYTNLNGDIGYWTNNTTSCGNTTTLAVGKDGSTCVDNSNADVNGIRPVITISKSQIKYDY